MFWLNIDREIYQHSISFMISMSNTKMELTIKILLSLNWLMSLLISIGRIWEVSEESTFLDDFWSHCSLLLSWFSSQRQPLCYLLSKVSMCSASVHQNSSGLMKFQAAASSKLTDLPWLYWESTRSCCNWLIWVHLSRNTRHFLTITWASTINRKSILCLTWSWFQL